MSSTSDKKAKFFFANCLHCDGIIRIPIAIRPSSDVACPHCANHTKLFDLMDQIPEGEVVAGQGKPTKASAVADVETSSEPTTQQENGRFVVPPQLAAGIKKRRRRRRRSSESGGESGSSRSQSGQSSSSQSSSSQSSSSQSSSSRPSANQSQPKSLSEAEENRQARKVEQSKRRREEFQKKREATAARPKVATAPTRPKRSRPPEVKRSPVLETAKVVLGGMIAAPIAYLLLLWVFSRDPLGLAPTIYSVAPGLVPEWIIDNEEDPELPSPAASETFPEQKGDEVDDFFKNLPTPESDDGFGNAGDLNGIDFNETVFD